MWRIQVQQKNRKQMLNSCILLPFAFLLATLVVAVSFMLLLLQDILATNGRENKIK